MLGIASTTGAVGISDTGAKSPVVHLATGNTDHMPTRFAQTIN